MATPTNSPKHDLGSLHIPERHRRESRTGKRVILAAIPILLLAGVVVLAYTFRLRKPIVEVAAARRSARRSRAQALLNASGYVTPRRRATVAAKITGRVTGSSSMKAYTSHGGPELATLDDSDVRAGA